jgi:hypothetical protein
MSELIPSASTKIKLAWANRPTDGSRYRRGNPLKPDATVLKSNVELAYMELKPPRMERHGSLYLEDHWKLACLCKDAIDDHLRNDRDLVRMAAIQVFGKLWGFLLCILLFTIPVLVTNISGIIGHEVALYLLHHRNGIYHWNQVAIANLPRDKRDKGKVEGCLELMLTLKVCWLCSLALHHNWLYAISTSLGYM